MSAKDEKSINNLKLNPELIESDKSNIFEDQNK